MWKLLCILLSHTILLYFIYTNNSGEMLILWICLLLYLLFWRIACSIVFIVDKEVEKLIRPLLSKKVRLLKESVLRILSSSNTRDSLFSNIRQNYDTVITSNLYNQLNFKFYVFRPSLIMNDTNVGFIINFIHERNLKKANFRFLYE